MSTYATNPLWQTVYGPYKLSAFNDTTGAFTMVPNTSYSGPHASPMSTYVGVPFTSNAAEWNAVKTGSVDFGYVPQEDVPQLSSLKGLGYNYYGLPDFGNYFVAYNFKDKTGNFNAVANQLYFRQAMQHLEDQAGQIKAYFNGAGDPAYGPIPAFPKSPFLPANAATNPYPFSVQSAMTVLKDNGWNVTPNGTDTCAKPGTATGDCGAGIPAGTKLAFNLIYNTTPPIPGQVEDLASNAKAAGIEIALSGSNFNFMIQNYNDAASPANENKWAMEDFGGETNSTYPTQFGVYNTGGSGQIGAYSNPTADSLINASVSGSEPERGHVRGVVLHDEPAGAVAAGARLHLGLEDEHLVDRTSGNREPDPVRQHAAVLVPEQVADRLEIAPSGLACLPVVNRETGRQPGREGPTGDRLPPAPARDVHHRPDRHLDLRLPAAARDLSRRQPGTSSA